MTKQENNILTENSKTLNEILSILKQKTATSSNAKEDIIERVTNLLIALNINELNNKNPDEKICRITIKTYYAMAQEIIKSQQVEKYSKIKESIMIEVTVNIAIFAEINRLKNTNNNSIN